MLTYQLWKFAGSFTPLIEVACRWLSQDLEIETLYPIESSHPTMFYMHQI